MKFYCIFETSTETKDYRFVDNYPDYSSADLMCQSMNNFSSDLPVYYCVRCLDKFEFEHIDDYVPYFRSNIA